MVLKQTKNEELIKKWIKEISSIYDLQNRGNDEVDNLGELLYILLTQIIDKSGFRYYNNRECKPIKQVKRRVTWKSLIYYFISLF